jgi:DNA-binding NtrC family response regulator
VPLPLAREIVVDVRAARRVGGDSVAPSPPHASGGAPPRSALDALIGESSAMRALRRRVARLVPTAVPVLIEGETGTGKELLARAIHDDGPRAAAPFVPLNCGALSAELVDAELFGHERGAFTGAVTRRPGRAAEAHGGTLFLDEIGELPTPLQCKLLRLLQGGEVQRVGSDRPVAVDVRIVAATNRDLRALVARGEFRADCYHRLAGFTVRVPALREREDDVVLLTEHLLVHFARHLGRPAPRLVAGAGAALVAYGWPGNVRELENVVREIVLYSDRSFLDARDVRTALAAREMHACDVPVAARALGASDLAELLGRYAGNVSRAALAAGVSRPTLYKRLREHGVDYARYRRAATRVALAAEPRAPHVGRWS